MAIPVSLDDAARHLRYEDGEELPPGRQADVEGFIADAAAWVEQYTGHILAAREVTEAFEGVESVHLRAWPIVSGTVPVVSYVDGGVTVPVPGARLSARCRPARVYPGAGLRWPFHARRQAFTVTLRAGYEDGDPVPGNLRRAMLVLIAAYDADREGGEVFAKAEAVARRLCRDFRLRRL